MTGCGHVGKLSLIADHFECVKQVSFELRVFHKVTSKRAASRNVTGTSRLGLSGR